MAYKTKGKRKASQLYNKTYLLKKVNGYGTKIVVRCVLEWGNRALTDGSLLGVNGLGQARGFAAITKYITAIF